MTRPLAALASLALVWLVACGDPEDLVVHSTTVPLYPDAPDMREIDSLVYAGGVTLTSNSAEFGGWSALEISPDGTRLLAVSDSAFWLTARIVYDEAGDLVGLADPVMAPLLDSQGAPLTGEAADAEGLAPLGEGRYAVSFERQHRIMVYEIGEDWSRIATALPVAYHSPPGLDRLRENGGLEALAQTSDGLWAAVEFPIVEGQPHTIWRLTESDAEPHSLRVGESFGLTGLTRIGDDSLIAVERFYARDIGNRIKIVRLSDAAFLDASTVASTDGPELLAKLTPSMTVDNFEAVGTAVIDGRLRIFLMSDDNYSPTQRTLLMSFVLADPGAD